MLLGIDIGTSATKALLCDEHGGIIAAASREYPLHAPRPGWSEQEPQDWWVATAGAIRELLKTPGVAAEAIAALSFSGQMHGSVLLGKDAAASGGKAAALRRALLWNDQRTAKEWRRLSGRRVGGVRWRWWNAALTVYAAQAPVGAGQ